MITLEGGSLEPDKQDCFIISNFLIPLEVGALKAIRGQASVTKPTINFTVRLFP